MEGFEAVSGAATLVGEEIGDGPSVVLLHAGVADRRIWRSVAERLADRYRVIAYDRRGFGETRYEAETFSHVDDLLAVLDARGVDRAVLVGNSQGGRVATDTALEHPERVAALLLIAPAIGGAPWPQEIPGRTLELEAAVDAADEAGDIEEANRLEAWLWLDGPDAAQGRIGGAARELFLDMNGIALRAADVGDERTVESAWDRIEQIAVPVLFLTGDLDVPVLLDFADELARRMPHAAAEVITGAAHLPMLENPELVARLIRTFVDRGAPAG